MKLTAPPRAGTGARPKATAVTTTPGYTNPNQQVVIRDTGAPSKARDRQTIYHLRCKHCGHDYGCNGMDIKARLCPHCQSGSAGEVLRDPQPSLFDESRFIADRKTRT